MSILTFILESIIPATTVKFRKDIFFIVTKSKMVFKIILSFEKVKLSSDIILLIRLVPT